MKKPNIEAKADALIVHALPGRLRLRFPGKKHDPGYFAQVLSALGAVPGVSKQAFNPRTGSVFCHYDPGAEKELQHFLAANDFFFLRQPSAVITTPEQAGAERSGHKAMKVPGKQLVALGLVGWSCYKLLRGQWATPEWYVTLWYAHSLYRQSE